jgi:predicted Zn-dependent protease
MKTKLLIVAILVAALSMIVIASAQMLIPANDRAQDVSQAPEHSPVIGESFSVERVDLIHYVKPTNPGTKPGSGTCYKLMGVKWATFPVRYTINPSNGDGIDHGQVVAVISTSAETWDGHTSKELFDNTVSLNYAAVYRTDKTDGVNAIVFGTYPEENVIAVTSVWYTRVGKQIVEFDMLFNDKFAWNTTGTSDDMDLQNIATHELGHAVGMGDIYTTSCSYVTMYGYSGEGDLSKRSLELPDIAGLQAMYGV